jgi:hypothetical protein
MKTIQHEAFVNLYNKDKKVFELIFKDTKTLSQLSKKIIKLSKTFDKFAYKNADKLKGDLFEIFSECFFKILSADNRIGVGNYQPDIAADDYGVDGFGIGMDEKPLTVQVKFRSDPTTLLKQEDLNQFGFQSLKKYRVDVDTKTNMVLFTNASGLHWITESKVFLGSIRSIGYTEISSLIDNNPIFWKEIESIITDTINEKYARTSKVDEATLPIVC